MFNTLSDFPLNVNDNMQSTFRRLANYVTSGPLSASVQEASGQIYPPIP